MNFPRIVLIVVLLLVLGGAVFSGATVASGDGPAFPQVQEDDDSGSVWNNPDSDDDGAEDAPEVDAGEENNSETAVDQDDEGVLPDNVDEDDLSEEDARELLEGEMDDEDDAGSITGGARSMLSDINPASDVMSPADAAEEVWERLTEMFAYGMTLFVEEVFNEALGTPTINNDGAFGIFGTPEALEEGDQTPSHKEAGVYDRVASENYVTIYEEIYLGLVMPMAMSIMFLLALLMLIAPAITAITR
jgi:hypothetical protein